MIWSIEKRYLHVKQKTVRQNRALDLSGRVLTEECDYHIMFGILQRRRTMTLEILM